MKTYYSSFLFTLAILAPSTVVAQELRHRKLVRIGDTSRIDGQYIVKLRDDVDDVDARIANFRTSTLRTDGSSSSSSGPSVIIKRTYRKAMKGFSVENLTQKELRELLDRDDVEYVEENRRIHTYTTQQNAPWGLDRIDQESKKLDGNYNYGDLTGAGVTVFVLDNGMLASHSDFGGRVTDCVNLVETEEDCVDGDGDDAHGTHVGATVGGATYGVAKGVNLVNIKVLTTEGGTTDDSIAALEYVAQQKSENPNTPMVANLSYGGSKSRAENEAVDATVDAGVVVVVAAGNEFVPACWSSPASASKAITVGATTKRDFKPFFSNWGRCVSIFAPGVSILSALPDSTTASTPFDGTSQAAPHVAGAAALYLEKEPSMTPAQVLQALEDDAKRGVWFRGFFSPNIIVNVKAIVESE